MSAATINLFFVQFGQQSAIMRNIELSLSKDVLVAVNIISVYHRHRQMANS